MWVCGFLRVHASLCVHLSSPAFLWSWVLTVSFAESPDSATTGSAQSGWTGILQALKIKFKNKSNHSATNTFGVWDHKLVISFVPRRRDNCTYPLHTCPSPLIPAARPPPCSDRCYRKQAGCCCCWGLEAATARCSPWPAAGWDLVVLSEPSYQSFLYSAECLVILFI